VACGALLLAPEEMDRTYIDAGMYAVVLFVFLVLVWPHPSVVRRPVLNEARLADSNSTKIDYSKIIRDETPATHKQDLLGRNSFMPCFFAGKPKSGFLMLIETLAIFSRMTLACLLFTETSPNTSKFGKLFRELRTCTAHLPSSDLWIV